MLRVPPASARYLFSAVHCLEHDGVLGLDSSKEVCNNLIFQNVIFHSLDKLAINFIGLVEQIDDARVIKRTQVAKMVLRFAFASEVLEEEK